MNNFIIPNVVHVGYQERSDTYTDRLGFITYIDDIGKMKFENSWNNWKDDDIQTSVFNNKPQTGFILNKNGDRSWNRFGGAEYVRVWDSRGHEFEISIDNLMKIILHNGISKGNEINGELVYAWEVGKKKITLMPTKCEEYQYYLKTKEQFKNMTLINNIKEIVPGFTYKTKANNIYAYLGQINIKAMKADLDADERALNKLVSKEKREELELLALKAKLMKK